MKPEKIQRFLTAQNQSYLRAMEEIKAGRKTSHWMWYIFPQLLGLGQSEMSEYYAIRNLKEATEYLNHPVLGKDLIEISKAVLSVDGKSANEIFGSPDDMKLHSSMTLFTQVKNADPVFVKVLNKYFEGIFDNRTMGLLQEADAL